MEAFAVYGGLVVLGLRVAAAVLREPGNNVGLRHYRIGNGRQPGLVLPVRTTHSGIHEQALVTRQRIRMCPPLAGDRFYKSNLRYIESPFCVVPQCAGMNRRCHAAQKAVIQQRIELRGKFTQRIEVLEHSLGQRVYNVVRYRRRSQ